jgi:hypothetical protein
MTHLFHSLIPSRLPRHSRFGGSQLEVTIFGEARFSSDAHKQSHNNDDDESTTNATSLNISAVYPLQQTIMSEPKQRKQRNNNLYTNNISYFRQDGEEGDRTYFATEDEAVAMLNGPIAKACFNGGRVNGVVWTRSNEGKSRNPSIDHWRKYRCPFSKSSDACPGECRISKSKQNGMYYIQFADVQHIHTTGEFKRGLSIAVKTTLFNSPLKLKKRPAENISRLVQIPEASGSRKEQGQVKTFQTHQKKKMHAGHLSFGVNANSYGAVVTTLDQLQLNVVAAAGANFTKHSAFLVTSPDEDYIAIDDPDEEEDNRIVAVISTENLLLNAFRASQQGGPISLHVDASHRYHCNDWLFYLPVSVTSMNQSCHIVAYALTSSEDADAQEFMFCAVKHHVERIVNEKINDPLVQSV